MLQTKVKRKTYQEKITEFNELYSPFEFIECVESQDGWCCEACGSHAPGHFFLYEDKNGRTRHVGGVCHEKLITTWRGRCEGCRCIRIVTKIEVRLPNGTKVIEPLCGECVNEWLTHPHPEGENKLYQLLMERHRVQRR